MKRVIKLTGILMVLIMSGTSATFGQRAMRGIMQDSLIFNRMRMGINRGADSTMMRNRLPGFQRNAIPRDPYGMRRGIGPGIEGMRIYRFRYPMYGMGRPMRPRDGMGPGSQMRSFPPPEGNRLIDNIPNLTDKQRKEISDLRDKQRQEMQKFRDNNQDKLRSMREAHLNNIMKLLTDDQKKWLEERSGNISSPESEKK